MRKLATLVDGILFQVSDIKRVTVSGFAGMFNEITGEWSKQVEFTFSYTEETDAASKFAELVASGEWDIVTAWAYVPNDFFPDSETCTEVETWYKNRMPDCEPSY